MRALVYNGPHNVKVQNMPDATIERPTDVLVKITATNICGSDLHIYEGRAPLDLRALAVPLYQRKKQLMGAAAKTAKEKA